MRTSTRRSDPQYRLNPPISSQRYLAWSMRFLRLSQTCCPCRPSFVILFPVYPAAFKFFNFEASGYHGFIASLSSSDKRLERHSKGSVMPIKETVVVERELHVAPCIERSAEHTSELQSLMRSSYAVF